MNLWKKLAYTVGPTGAGLPANDVKKMCNSPDEREDSGMPASEVVTS